MISKEDIREVIREELEKFKAGIVQAVVAVLEVQGKTTKQPLKKRNKSSP